MTPKKRKSACRDSVSFKQMSLESFFSSKKQLTSIKREDQNETTKLSRLKICRSLFENSSKIENYPIINKQFHISSTEKQKHENKNSENKNDTLYTPQLYKPLISYNDYGRKSLKMTNNENCVNIDTSKRSPETSEHKKQVSKRLKSREKNNSTTPAKIPKIIDYSPQKDMSPDKSSSLPNDNLKLYVLQKIVITVLSQSRFRNLLAGDEEEKIKRFFEMPQLNQYVCYKLFNRQNIWYNVFKFGKELQLNRSESELMKMYWELKETNYVKTDYSCEDSFILLNNLLKEDLTAICKSFKIAHKSIHKSDLVSKIMKFINSQPTSLTPLAPSNHILQKKINERMGYCIKITQEFFDLIYKFYVLYFLTDGSSEKISDWNHLFFQVETGEIIYPKFEVDEQCIVFYTKEEFLEYQKSILFQQKVASVVNKKDWSSLLNLCIETADKLKEIVSLQNNENDKPSFLKRFSAGHIYVKILSSNIDFLMCKYPQETYPLIKLLLEQKLFKQSKRGSWYEKLAWIEWRYFKKHIEAANTLIKCFKEESLDEVAKQDLCTKARNFKKCKSAKLPNLICDDMMSYLVDTPDHVPFAETVIDAVTVRENESGKKRKYVTRNDEGETNFMSVESVAKEHYRDIVGFPNVIKSEGKVLITLYFISFWDIIYSSSVKNVFISKMQSCPLDFYSKHFYESRKTEIDRRLTDLEKNWTKNELREFIVKICAKDEAARIRCDFVYDPSELCEIIWCIGRVQFAKICKRFVEKFYLFSSGLPDLFMWSVDEQKAKFVEVKGENDTLSTKQKLWLDFFRSIGADAEVCYVHSTGSRGGKKYEKSITKSIIL